MPNAETPYSHYWNGTLIGVMATIAVAALFPYFQELRRHKHAWRLPPQPLRSLSECGVVLAVLYFLVGLISRLVESPKPLMLYAYCGAGVVLMLSMRFVLFDRWVIREAEQITKTAELAQRTLKRYKATTDIENIFAGVGDVAFARMLEYDLGQSDTVNVVCVGHGPVDELSAVWRPLQAFMSRGGRVQLVSEVPPRTATAIQYRRLPEAMVPLVRGFVAIDCGGPLYFGIGSRKSDVSVVHFNAQPGTDGGIAHGLVALTRQIHSMVAADGLHTATIQAAMSPEEYKQLVLPLEARATSIDRIPKRLSVVFKATRIVEAIAAQRYGTGSHHIGHYVEEHRERKKHFYAALGRGMICREIYNKAELISYVTNRRHGSRVSLTREQIDETVLRWRDAVLSQDNYLVGLADTPLPFKYEIIDGAHFIMHEAIGDNDEGRMNAFCVSGREFCRGPLSDFEMIWNGIAPEERERENVGAWIDAHLRNLV